MLISRQHIPLSITLARIACIPILIAIYFSNLPYANWLSFLLFSLSGISDWADGYLARKWKVTSHFGAFIDPIADKLMIMSALILIATQHPHWGYAVASIVIIGREIGILAWRQWLAQNNMSDKTSVNILGKIKTITQFVALGFLILYEPVDFLYTSLILNTALIGNVLLALAVLLTLISFLGYIHTALRKKHIQSQT